MGAKNRAYKRGEPYKDAQLILIACEGAKREPEYFRALAKQSYSQRLKIQILSPGESNDDPDDSPQRSAPKWIINRISRYIEKQGINLEKGDTVWIVLDRDRWELKELYDLHLLCEEEEWGFVISNPCFEVWLLLHIKTVNKISGSSCKELKIELGNSVKGGYKIDEFLPFVHQATARALANDADKENPVPPGLSTRVYLPVQIIIGKSK